MALTLATVGGKITAALYNALVNWVQPLGTFLVVPTSVAVGSGTFTLSALGKVTFNGASSVSINGCFTATYDNYYIVLNVPVSSAANNIAFRLRLAGTDDSSANYDDQGSNFANATVSTSQLLAATSIGMEAVNSTIHDMEVWLIAPNLNQPTRGEGKAKTTSNPVASTTTANTNRQILFRNSTQFDGFSLIASTGTITGTVRFFGWNNG